MPVNYTHTLSWQDIKKKISVAECYEIIVEHLPSQVLSFEKKNQEKFVRYAQLEIFNVAKNTESIDRNFKEQICPKIVKKSFQIFLIKQKNTDSSTQLSNLMSEAKLQIFDEYKADIYPFIEFNDNFDEKEKTLLKSYTFQCGLDKIQRKNELVLKITGHDVGINPEVYYSFIKKKVFLNCVKKELEANNVSLNSKYECLKKFNKSFDSSGQMQKIKFSYSNTHIAELEERFEDHIFNLRLELIEKIKENQFCLSSELDTYVYSVISNRFKEDCRKLKITIPLNYEIIEAYAEEENHEGNMILYFLKDYDYAKTLDPMKIDIFKMDLEGIKDDKIAEKYGKTTVNIRKIRSRIKQDAFKFLIKNAPLIGKWIKKQDTDE